MNTDFAATVSMPIRRLLRRVGFILILVSGCFSSAQAETAADNLAENIEAAIIKYLAETRNFTLSEVAQKEPLGSAFKVPSVHHAADLDGVLNTGQHVDLVQALTAAPEKKSFYLDQQYQLKWNYAAFITRELKPWLRQHNISQQAFLETLSSSGIVFNVYREKLEQPLDSLGVGIMRKPTQYVVATVQTLRLGRLQYDHAKQPAFDELVGVKNVFADLAALLSKQQIMLDGKNIAVGDVGAVKLALGRIM